MLSDELVGDSEVKDDFGISFQNSPVYWLTKNIIQDSKCN